MPFVGSEDQFEDEYTGKFRTLAAKHGLVLKYEKDLAGIDIGLHLYDESAEGDVSSPLSLRRAWFQLKGKHSSTLSAGELGALETVPVGKIKLDSLRFWYALPEPVYLAVYVEATDEFLIEDVRKIVDRQWGDTFLSGSTFKIGQKDVTLHVSRGAVLDEQTWAGLGDGAPTIRVDGPQWRGRPLGHRFDPLRSAMTVMEPAAYHSLVERLLEVHGFEAQEEVDIEGLYGSSDSEVLPTLTVGRMHYTYEWTHPLFTEFGYDPGETFRIEGEPLFAQGAVAVLVHGDAGMPNHEKLGELAAGLYDRGIQKLLVFDNSSHDSGAFGSYFAGAKPLICIPQDLSSLAFNVLTATSVFLEFRDRIDWGYVNYL